MSAAAPRRRRQDAESCRAGATPSRSMTRTVRLTVRKALAGDRAPLEFFFDTALRKDYFVRRGQLQEILDGRHHQVLVAEIDAVLVGVAIVTCGCRLVNALVHPAYRGLGIGAALVRESKASEVRAKTDMSTGDPRAFYRGLGFESTGEWNDKRNIEVMRIAAAQPTLRGRSTRSRRGERARELRKQEHG